MRHAIDQITQEPGLGWLVTCACGSHSGWNDTADEAKAVIDVHLRHAQ